MRRIISCCLMVLMLVAACGCSLPGPASAAPASKDEKKPSKPPVSKFDALRRFGQVLDIVERSYVRDVAQSELVDGAIKGMLQGLDPHSTFLTVEEYRDMQEMTSGEFYGIGVEITMENGQVVVMSPIEDTPAFKAGMKTGDIILTIDGQSTQEMSLQDVVARIRGPKGSKVQLTILHPGGGDPMTISLTRASVPIISVKSRPFEDGYYWVRVTRFSERTTDELLDALKTADKQSRGGLKGIVLDLRNNPGGLLNQAVSVSDVFLRQGPIVSIRGREGTQSHVYSAENQPTDVHVPLVVLINAGSASASEIVAGALKDHHRALICGERSFGKGSVQNIIPLADGAGLKLTVALYYTPNDISIQAAGVTPDIEVPFEEPVKQERDRLLLREADLNRHIESGRQPAKKKEGDSPDGQQMSEVLARDNQLRMALQFVKGLPSLQQIKN